MEKRALEGEFLNLYNGLMDDEQKCYEYFWMTQYAFHILHRKIENNIKNRKLIEENLFLLDLT